MKILAYYSRKQFVTLSSKCSKITRYIRVGNKNSRNMNSRGQAVSRHWTPDREIAGSNLDPISSPPSLDRMGRHWTRGMIQQASFFSILFYGRPFFDVVRPAFLLAILVLSTHKGDALRNGSGEAVVVRDLSEPCEFSSLDSCQMRFPWAHNEDELAPHPVDSQSISVFPTSLVSFFLLF